MSKKETKPATDQIEDAVVVSDENQQAPAKKELTEEEKEQTKAAMREEQERHLAKALVKIYKRAFFDTVSYMVGFKKTLTEVREEIKQKKSPLHAAARHFAEGIREEAFWKMCQVMNINLIEKEEEQNEQA